MNTHHSKKTQNHTLNKLATSILCAMAFGGLSAASPEASAAPEFMPGRIIVKPLPGLAQKHFGNILDSFGRKAQNRQDQISVEKQIDQIGSHVIKVAEGREDEFVELFSKHPLIAFAGRDMIVEPSVTANDPFYAYAWHLSKIQAPAAWDITLGSSEVTVAVLDSGVDASHPDLAGKLKLRPDGKVDGWNVVSQNDDTTPIAGHGTWVAGVIAAANNNSLGVTSVGWNTVVQPVRVTNDPSGSASWTSLANGLVWAAEHGAKVANISYNMGYGCNAFILDGAAQYFRSKGGVVVTAAGNDGSNGFCPDDPYLIIVSATTSTDAKASWSNYGSFIDIAAPGVGIYTTSTGGSYSSASGTSFSSPITAGVVALMMAVNPNLTADQYESVLKQSADNIGGGSLPNPYFGWGRVNAANAVGQAANYVPPDTTPPTTAIVSPANGATLAGMQVVSVSAQDNVNVAKVEFYANNQLVDKSTVSPHQFSWDTSTVADGNVPIYSYAYDSAGNRGSSAVKTVKVLNHPPVPDITPPTVAIYQPANGARVSGTVQVMVTASDNVALKQVQLKIDGKIVSTTNSSPLVYSWNTRRVSSGSHTLTGIATDTSDLASQSVITVRK